MSKDIFRTFHSVGSTSQTKPNPKKKKTLGGPGLYPIESGFLALTTHLFFIIKYYLCKKNKKTKNLSYWQNKLSNLDVYPVYTKG